MSLDAQRLLRNAENGKRKAGYMASGALLLSDTKSNRIVSLIDIPRLMNALELQGFDIEVISDAVDDQLERGLL